MELFQIGFLQISMRDFIDVSLVAVIVYKLYQVMSDTRAAQMIGGLALIVVISFFVEALQMSGMSWLIGNIKTVWIIAFVIIFQPEIRRLLIQVGQSRVIRSFFKVGEYKVLEEIASAACELSEKRYGALIVMVRDTGIKTIVETGIALQAKASKELIVSIFSPRSPLHDGAVIIHEDFVEAAKCILPLTQSLVLDQSLGTRHQAALGISEESDAVVIVVSEESGKISIAQDGKLTRGLKHNSLMEELSKSFRFAAE